MLNRVFLVAALLTGMLFLTACSLWEDDDNDAENGAAASPTPEELTGELVLQHAAERWNETESLHFVLDAEGDTFLDSDRSIRLISGEGDLARPASVEATARVSVAVATVNVNIIVIEDEAYMTNLISGDWERAPEDFSYNPALLFDEENGLATIMQDIQEPTLEGTESVDGRDAHLVTGFVTEAQIEDITAGSVAGDQIAVSIWLAEDNYDVLRLNLSAPGAEDGGETTWDLVFTDHNADVSIEAPI